MNIFAYLLNKMLRLLKLKVIPIGDLPPNSAEIIERAIQNCVRQINTLFSQCSQQIPDPIEQAKALFNEFSSCAPKGQYAKSIMAKAKDIFEKIQTLNEEIQRLKELKINFERGHPEFFAGCKFVKGLKKIADEIKQSQIFLQSIHEMRLKIEKNMQEEQKNQLKFSELYQMVRYVLLRNFYSDNTLKTFSWAGSPSSIKPYPSPETIEKLIPIYRLLNECSTMFNECFTRCFTRCFSEYEKKLEDITTLFNQSRINIFNLLQMISFDDVSDFIEQNRNNEHFIESLNELERKLLMESSIERKKSIIDKMEQFLNENTRSGPDGDKSKPTYSDVQIWYRQMNRPNDFLKRIKVNFYSS